MRGKILSFPFVHVHEMNYSENTKFVVAGAERWKNMQLSVCIHFYFVPAAHSSHTSRPLRRTHSHTLAETQFICSVRETNGMDEEEAIKIKI